MSRSPLLTSLPLELIRIIVELAASHSEHQATITSLLLVSKTVHDWILPLRFRAIVVSGIYAERFLVLLREPSFAPFLSQIQTLCLLDIHRSISSNALTSALSLLRPECRIAIPVARISAFRNDACLCTHVVLITSAWAAPARSDSSRGPQLQTVYPSSAPIRTDIPRTFSHITHLAIGPDHPKLLEKDLRRAIPRSFPSLTHLAIFVRIRPFVLREEADDGDPMDRLRSFINGLFSTYPGRLRRVYIRLYKWDMLRGVEDPTDNYVEQLRSLLVGVLRRRIFIGSTPIPRRRLESETYALWALGDAPWEGGQPVLSPS